MKEQSRQREIEKVKEIQKNPMLKISEINNLEVYLKSLEEKK